MAHAWMAGGAVGGSGGGALQPAHDSVPLTGLAQRYVDTRARW